MLLNAFPHLVWSFKNRQADISNEKSLIPPPPLSEFRMIKDQQLCLERGSRYYTHLAYKIALVFMKQVYFPPPATDEHMTTVQNNSSTP